MIWYAPPPSALDSPQPSLIYKWVRSGAQRGTSSLSASDCIPARTSPYDVPSLSTVTICLKSENRIRRAAVWLRYSAPSHIYESGRTDTASHDLNKRTGALRLLHQKPSWFELRRPV
ncbi:Dihydrodipicolinate reductase-like protein CRR1, chloroplastic [Frankliniella fusca]|uniref:Dihydrodipicolinate reductase-like protein CRR1, chloroplastic n=1 Tax=Frankliniella fusca TaxID=407009 RepID=A0AAE1HP14_9NEOP|nr:Dihydrodipicolinate reductase-like protein CRR1, chloroplastic [Frankliniella fusca]